MIHLYISNSIKLYLNSCCYLFIKKSLRVSRVWRQRGTYFTNLGVKIGFQNFVLEEASKMADKRSTNNKLEKLRRKISLNSFPKKYEKRTSRLSWSGRNIEAEAEERERECNPMKSHSKRESLSVFPSSLLALSPRAHP